MTNIWTQSFEEIRKPHFEMEDPYTNLGESKKKGDGNLANNYPPYDKVTRGDVIAGALDQDQMGGKGGVEDSDSDKKADKAGMKKYHMTSAEWEKSSMDKKADAKLAKKTKNEGYIDEAQVANRNSSKDKKIDVMSGKNKVAINPQIKEEVEEWVAELVEEGYDLSDFTWDEMADIYIDEMSEGTADMPATGDAETVSVTNPQLASAKRRATQAQITADMARIKLQKASAMTKESFDSIVEYLSQRNDVFKNLEEGVFDPKKSKLRPASERTKNTITDAERKAAKKEADRVAAIHSRGDTVLAGMRPQGKKGKVKTTTDAKPEAPEANRVVKGRYDKLAKAAGDVLKSVQG